MTHHRKRKKRSTGGLLTRLFGTEDEPSLDIERGASDLILSDACRSKVRRDWEITDLAVEFEDGRIGRRLRDESCANDTLQQGGIAPAPRMD